MSEWISVKERLPQKPTFDWVLVQTKMIPEGWYGVPHIAELRGGVWFAQCLDDKPMENELSIEVTHWMPIPEPPESSNNKFEPTRE
jgi:hypothetical protein